MTTYPSKDELAIGTTIGFEIRHQSFSFQDHCPQGWEEEEFLPKFSRFRQQ